MVCSMMKKGLMGAALGAGALALVFGTSAPSYVKTAFHKARTNIKDAIPDKFEIERVRQMVADLEPAIQSNIETLAKNEVEVKHLQRQIALTQDNLAQEQKKIAALRDLADRKDLLTSGTSYSADDVARELKGRFAHYLRVEEKLDQEKKTLEVRQKAIAAAREQLSVMHAKKAELTAKIDAIEAEMKQIEATQAANSFSLDDSALSRVKEAVTDLEKRLDVMKEKAELEGRYAGDKIVTGISVEDPKDIVREIDAKFGAPQGEKTAEKSL